jgi:hypothetical protein
MESRTGIAKRGAPNNEQAEERNMDGGGGSWGIINIVGPLLLAAVLLWVLLRNRKTSKRDVDRSEQGTRDLYREEEEKRRSGDDRTS